MTRSGSARVHDAWVILAGTALAMLAASGMRGAFGVFIKPIVGELSGWIFFSHQIGSAVGSFADGYLYDRHGDYTIAFHSADLALCEAVTGELRDLLERYSLEVSSPGVDRPLTKPEHFRRFLGRRVRVRTTDAIEGRRNFTGTIAEADDDSVLVAAEGTPVRIPITGIKRSNLIGDLEFGGES